MARRPLLRGHATVLLVMLTPPIQIALLCSVFAVREVLLVAMEGPVPVATVVEVVVRPAGDVEKASEVSDA